MAFAISGHVHLLDYQFFLIFANLTCGENSNFYCNALSLFVSFRSISTINHSIDYSIKYTSFSLLVPLSPPFSLSFPPLQKKNKYLS